MDIAILYFVKSFPSQIHFWHGRNGMLQWQFTQIQTLFEVGQIAKKEDQNGTPYRPFNVDPKSARRFSYAFFSQF